MLVERDKSCSLHSIRYFFHKLLRTPRMPERNSAALPTRKGEVTWLRVAATAAEGMREKAKKDTHRGVICGRRLPDQICIEKHLISAIAKRQTLLFHRRADVEVVALRQVAGRRFGSPLHRHELAVLPTL